jgi:heparan-alpha-glucosaminide N-acetyltransferase
MTDSNSTTNSNDTPATTNSNSLSKSTSRLLSIDAYRGFVMLLMMAEMVHLSSLAKIYPNITFFEWLKFHTTHVEWIGCSLHDLIQPSFSFLVGTSLAFSLLKRSAKQSTLAILLHAAWRSLFLIILGIFLRSLHREQTYFTFEDTLTQIGLGYFPLVLIGRARLLIAPLAIAVLLVGYWGLFALYPLPPAEFDYAAVGVPADWPHRLEDFQAHWNKNSNPAWAFDRWWLNLFPREEPFQFNRGGYATLSFIPTLATMLLGLIAGRCLANNDWTSKKKLLFCFLAAAFLMFSAWTLASLGLCPIVKRIWTPTWTLWSGGWCFALMGLFYLLLDLAKWDKPLFPILVIGANSIASYVMAETIPGWVGDNLMKHFGKAPFMLGGESLQPILLGASNLFCLWLILLWMYRNKYYVKI